MIIHECLWSFAYLDDFWLTFHFHNSFPLAGLPASHFTVTPWKYGDSGWIRRPFFLVVFFGQNFKTWVLFEEQAGVQNGPIPFWRNQNRNKAHWNHSKSRLCWFVVFIGPDLVRSGKKRTSFRSFVSPWTCLTWCNPNKNADATHIYIYTYICICHLASSHESWAYLRWLQ